MDVLSIDIGGNFIKFALIGDDKKLQHKSKVPTPKDNLENLMRAIDKIYCSFHNIDGIAVSMPGSIDSEDGIARTGGALEYIKSFPMRSVLHEKYHVPVWVGNDAKCAGYAEIGFGVLKDVNDAVVIILGTAIGGCIIQNKKIRQGKNFAAGEVSYLIVDYQNKEKIWYTQGGKDGLLSIVQKCIHSTQYYSGEEIFSMLQQGNKSVSDAIDEYAYYIAVQLYNLQVVLDVEKIAIGGGISAQPILIEKINAQFNRLFEQYDSCIKQIPIVACKYRNDANLLGAYYQFNKYHGFG